MHHLASELLSCVNVGQVIDSQNYDSFCNLVERLRLEISSLKREIELSLYTHDPLTGAINRVDMLPVLREIQSMDKRLSQNSSLIMIDLDLFKKVNDKFGHPVGDKVLQVIARFLMDNLRPYDKLFRYGGEEFLICLHNTSFKDCYDRIEILRDRLSKKQIDIGKRDPIYITASFGIAELDTQLPIEDAIEHADKALYAAKAAGRNCTRTWPN
ncbi:MAG TPA: GGDEF domain-containing protein [Holosporales bacterium]|nr:GGDEF domain-containing protein [Holosporales bacterium]HBW25497.1 GGDEF domain-containing protein [Holosporales bacterium]HCC25470.1 GGDEF domain-containing protein [Holosporales bacterium]